MFENIDYVKRSGTIQKSCKKTLFGQLVFEKTATRTSGVTIFLENHLPNEYQFFHIIFYSFPRV